MERIILPTFYLPDPDDTVVPVVIMEDDDDYEQRVNALSGDEARDRLNKILLEETD